MKIWFKVSLSDRSVAQCLTVRRNHNLILWQPPPSSPSLNRRTCNAAWVMFWKFRTQEVGGKGAAGGGGAAICQCTNLHSMCDAEGTAALCRAAVHMHVHSGALFFCCFFFIVRRYNPFFFLNMKCFFKKVKFCFRWHESSSTKKIYWHELKPCGKFLFKYFNCFFFPKLL